MASQLAIELTLEQADACIFALPSNASGTPPSYAVGNINLIPEILEFDASYDSMFLQGLRDGGVPLKFSSWHTFIFTTQGASNVSLQVQERSRSVKSLFCVQRRSPVRRDTDSHATFFDTSDISAGTDQGGTLGTYQYRIGGRYFPAAPVQCSDIIGGLISNGGAEAFIELQKALNIVGDYRLSTGVNAVRWATSPALVPQLVGNGGLSTTLNEVDYTCSIVGFGQRGNPAMATVTIPSATIGNGFAGNLGSACFAAGISLETSNGLEISGLNAEEQSDISFLCQWKSGQQSGFVLEVYSYYDAMIILRENNVLELIQ